MKKEIKLELKKLNVKRQAKGILIVIFCLLLYETLGVVNNRGERDSYGAYFPWIMNLMVTMAFIVYSSVLTTGLIIGEYTSRTILILFSYPVDRKRIILVKLGIVVCVTMLCIFAGNVLCNLYVIGLDAAFDVIVGNPTPAYLLQALRQTAFGMVMGGLLSTLPFVFGMIRKSIPAAFISSVAVAGLFMEAVGLSAGGPVTLLLCAVLAVMCCVAVAYTLKHRIDQLDCGN